MNTFLPYVYVIMSGIVNTLILSITGFILATVLGLIFSFIEIYGHNIISLIIDWMLRIIRGIPLVLMLFIIFYGLPQLGIRLSPIVSAILGIGIIDSAYQAQLFRGIIITVSERQLEAAYSIGLSTWNAFRYIVIPQAFRIALPAWINEFSIVLKDSSIAYAIGVTEIFTQAIHVANATMDYLTPLVFVSIIYFLICYPLSQLSNHLHKKLSLMGFI